MPGYYSYLVSSLPTLQFGMPPPFLMEDYLLMMEGFIPGNEVETIHQFVLEQYSPELLKVKMIADFFACEAAIRNHLARLRSADRDISPEKFVRSLEVLIDQRMEQSALDAYKTENLLESEKMLDLARWKYLDELATGHVFDFNTLLIYAMKLRILRKWQVITEADKNMIFNATVESFKLQDVPISRS